MRWIPMTMLAVLAALHQVCCSGVFELRLKSFINDYGKDSVGQCCSGERASSTGVCSGTCRTRFRVCLKHYQAKIDTTSPCTFGDVITPVLGGNNVHLLDSTQDGFSNPIRFPFDFTWPGTFSLIVEALHDNNATSRSGGETLITRLTTQRWLDVGQNWTEDEHRSSHSVMSYEYRVTCDEHYYGAGCANLCRPRDDQFGHYTCSPTGTRVCVAGWEGDYCTKPQCSEGCHKEHGHCTKPGECLCHSGWKGSLCNECERYPGCLHGTCQKPWDCLCDEGWGGLFCNQDLNYCTNHKPCRHGGTCFNTGQGSYTCTCPPGFTGTDCEKELDDCTHNQPCLNNGVCKDNGTSYRCECPKGWLGPHCETPAQTCEELLCKNGATCKDTSQGYSCLCSPGFSGVNCETEINECESSPCLNGATCVDRISNFDCVCPSGFNGTRCEVNIDDCNGNPCQNGGSCVDLVNKFRCQCIPGYVGDFCQSKVDYCQTKPCANGGTCMDLVNDYKCTCRPGFTGKDCSIDVDECSSSPCRNGATCLNRVNSFQCKCPPGFHGPLCSEEATSANEIASVEVPWSAGNISRQVSEPTDDSGLSTKHVVVIATLSTAVPVLVLVAAVVVMCMKQRRKREQQKADDEARMQNEQNAVHSSMAKRGGPGSGGDTHMIKNTWDKCINNVLAANTSPSPDDGGGGGGGHVSVSGDLSNSDLCYPKQQVADNSGPVYSLQRTKSHKQLNTDAAVHRQSNRTSALLNVSSSAKLDKDFDNLCPSARTSSTGDKRISVLSVDSSLCNTSDPTLMKRSHDKDSSSILSPGAGPTSSVYVIDEHFHHPDGLLATEV
ncbi:neurogenic locus protein delta isoform X2 [Anabrus simplex]